MWGDIFSCMIAHHYLSWFMFTLQTTLTALELSHFFTGVFSNSILPYTKFPLSLFHSPIPPYSRHLPFCCHYLFSFALFNFSQCFNFHYLHFHNLFHFHLCSQSFCLSFCWFFFLFKFFFCNYFHLQLPLKCHLIFLHQFLNKSCNQFLYWHQHKIDFDCACSCVCYYLPPMGLAIRWG